MLELNLRVNTNGVSFDVRVAPRASRASIVGVHDGALKVSLTAPPVDGAANDALVALLSSALGVSKRSVQITRGERSKHKSVTVDGVTEAAVRALISSA